MGNIGKNKKENKKNRIFLYSGLLLAIGGVLLRILAMNVTEFADWYVQWIYPILTGTIGRISSFVPFSLMEVGGYVLLIMLFVLLRKHWKQPAWMLSRSVWLAGMIVFLFVINSGINYYHRPFSSYLEWEMRDSSSKELWELCCDLTSQLNETTIRLEKMEEEQGMDTFDTVWTRKQYVDEAVSSMKHLGESYVQLSGYYPRPKPLLASWLFSVTQLAGMYCPFTIEANYNADMVAYNIPHTICHELSHLKGFMREDEANFIGYLASIESESEVYQYSGAMLGWIYATNALYSVSQIPLEDGTSLTGAEGYALLAGQLNERARADMNANNQFWDKYESTVAEVANQVNDAYLKINSQEDGVKSYGRVVDLMLAYYRKNE